MRYKVNLQYRGTNYHGWQIQPNAITVQEILEKAFSTILQEKTGITGAGRTDTGVHASYYVAHFDSIQKIPDLKNFAFKINRFLPKDISISNVSGVSDDFHARFSAISRTYEYVILTEKNPFFSDLSYYLYGKIDFDKMNECAKILLEYTDFTSFSKLHTDTKTNDCIIYKAEWKKDAQILGKYVFTIKANRFLRNMVRAIVGTLLDVGKGKITCDDFRKIIENKNRSNAGFSVPPEGLFLVNIEY